MQISIHLFLFHFKQKLKFMYFVIADERFSTRLLKYYSINFLKMFLAVASILR